jgi:low affinity Fe/Cu permease
MKKFDKIAGKTAEIAGKPVTSLIMLSAVLLWAISGPAFNYSDTWQLVINTSTTVITFLMVFLIQNSQNRDGLAIQAKLDELIDATDGARNELEHLEEADEDTIRKKRK